MSRNALAAVIVVAIILHRRAALPAPAEPRADERFADVMAGFRRSLRVVDLMFLAGNRPGEPKAKRKHRGARAA